MALDGFLRVLRTGRAEAAAHAHWHRQGRQHRRYRHAIRPQDQHENVLTQIHSYLIRRRAATRLNNHSARGIRPSAIPNSPARRSAAR
jgi:hypothetical protein